MMRKTRFLLIIAFLCICALAGGIAFAQTARPPVQEYQFGSQLLQPQSVTASNVDLAAGCGADKVTDMLSTVFERADAARAYERCMTTTFAQARAVQSQSSDIVSASALQNLESTVLRDVRLQAEAAQADADFMGLGWGLGFGYSIAGDDIIESAEVVNGVVRVTDDRTCRAQKLHR